MIKKLAMFLLLSVFAVACGDNLMEDTLADDGSNKAKQVDLEAALNDKDYDFIVSKLERGDNATYGDLSSREKYLLSLAWLGQTKFDVLANISNFFEDNLSTGAIISSLQGDSRNLTGDEIQTQKMPLYNKILGMTDPDNNTTNDEDLVTVAGIASAMKVLMSITDMTNGLLPALASTPLAGIDNVSFDEEDPNYIVNIFDNLTETEVKTALESLVPMLNGDLSYLQDAVDTFIPEDLADEADEQEIKEKMDEYIDKLKGGGATITAQSAYDFIMQEMGKKN
ncbi:MAG: hypothetical protein LBV09_03015 [Deferribacteraceae bacterium]|jgi:hypothetical protein|nr:hypothetical protein [Deferribacteraceae bacterium]